MVFLNGFRFAAYEPFVRVLCGGCKGQAADLGKNGSKKQTERRQRQIVCLNAQKISTQQSQYDKHQGKQGGQGSG